VRQHAVVVFITFFIAVPVAAQTDIQKVRNLATCLGGRYPTLCNKGWLNAEESKKVDVAERRENLKTCLSGRYPTLCNQSRLTPEEAVQLAAAERRENLSTCLTGRYKVLCKKNLLSEAEGRQVLIAEQAENLRTCLTGRYQALCDKYSLTKDQLARTQAAEISNAKSSTSAGGTRSRRRSASGSELDHWVESVSNDGEIVKLEDGSIWEVDSVDAIDSSLWLPITDIVACDDKLINTEDNETVSATRIR
jgi:hypothetical protein